MAGGGWRLFMCGTNHTRTSVEEREPLGFGREDLAAAVAAFSERPEVAEAVIVSTCNRTEFYFVASRRTDPLAVVGRFYTDYRSLDISPLNDKFFLSQGREVAEHLFRVAGGLDSMVLGENQVLGQVKEAYSAACSVKAAGKVIHRLFHQAFRVGKQIRTDTEMGKGACSVSSAAMDLLRAHIGDMKEPSVLFVGANQMISLAATNLGREAHGSFYFANRTPEKAQALALRHESEGYGLDRLPDLMSRADVMITCTGADRPIVDSAMINRALTGHESRRFVIIDMAIPRDVDYEQDGHHGVEVYDLQDVQRHVREQQERRREAVPQAEEIVRRRLDEFMYWYEQVRRAPVSTSVMASVEHLRREELADVLSDLSPDQRQRVDEATRRLTRRLIQLSAKTCSKCSKGE